ncbi:MAG: DNA polymerase [bacterium]|nr:DNA polymerase [bacterium]
MTMFTGFNLKEKIKELKRRGKDVPREIFDLGVAFWLINVDEEKYTGEYLAPKYLHKEFNNSEAILEELKKYAENKLKEFNLGRLFYKLEMPLLEVLADMELNGISADKNKLANLDKKIGKILKGLTEKIYNEAGKVFNINSPKQVADILFNKLKIIAPVGGRLKKTSTGAVSTNIETLATLKNEHKIVGFILEYRELFKLQSTYVKSFQELISKDRRIHTTYLQTGTVTGRLSSENPNMQNVPAGTELSNEFKRCFEAKKGYEFVSFDYSQVELRVLASLSGDPKMIDAFKKGVDIHKLTASQVNNVPLEKVTPEMRNLAKTLNFGVVYGMGFIAFAKSSGLSVAEAKKFIAEYFSDFKEIKKWQERVKAEARKNCFVSNLNGRRRWLLNIVSSYQFLASQAEREAINMPVQSLAADILKISMVKVAEYLKEKGWYGGSVRPLLTIHDELLFEVKSDIIKKVKADIADIMENAFKLSVPLKVPVKAGKNWGEMKSFV